MDLRAVRILPGETFLEGEMRLEVRKSFLPHSQDGFAQQGRPFKRRLAIKGDIPNAYRVSPECWEGARVSRAPFCHRVFRGTKRQRR